MYHQVESFESIKHDIKNINFFWKPDVILISESFASSCIAGGRKTNIPNILQWIDHPGTR